MWRWAWVVAQVLVVTGAAGAAPPAVEAGVDADIAARIADANAVLAGAGAEPAPTAAPRLTPAERLAAASAGLPQEVREKLEKANQELLAAGTPEAVPQAHSATAPQPAELLPGSSPPAHPAPAWGALPVDPKVKAQLDAANAVFKAVEVKTEAHHREDPYANAGVPETREEMEARKERERIAAAKGQALAEDVKKNIDKLSESKGWFFRQRHALKALVDDAEEGRGSFKEREKAEVAAAKKMQDLVGLLNRDADAKVDHVYDVSFKQYTDMVTWLSSIVNDMEHTRMDATERHMHCVLALQAAIRSYQIFLMHEGKEMIELDRGYLGVPLKEAEDKFNTSITMWRYLGARQQKVFTYWMNAIEKFGNHTQLNWQKVKEDTKQLEISALMQNRTIERWAAYQSELWKKVGPRGTPFGTGSLDKAAVERAEKTTRAMAKELNQSIDEVWRDSEHEQDRASSNLIKNLNLLENSVTRQVKDMQYRFKAAQREFSHWFVQIGKAEYVKQREILNSVQRTQRVERGIAPRLERAQTDFEHGEADFEDMLTQNMAEATASLNQVHIQVGKAEAAQRKEQYKIVEGEASKLKDKVDEADLAFAKEVSEKSLHFDHDFGRVMMRIKPLITKANYKNEKVQFDEADLAQSVQALAARRQQQRNHTAQYFQQFLQRMNSESHRLFGLNSAIDANMHVALLLPNDTLGNMTKTGFHRSIEAAGNKTRDDARRMVAGFEAHAQQLEKSLRGDLMLDGKVLTQDQIEGMVKDGERIANKAEATTNVFEAKERSVENEAEYATEHVGKLKGQMAGMVYELEEILDKALAGVRKQAMRAAKDDVLKVERALKIDIEEVKTLLEKVDSSVKLQANRSRSDEMSVTRQNDNMFVHMQPLQREIDAAKAHAMKQEVKVKSDVNAAERRLTHSVKELEEEAHEQLADSTTRSFHAYDRMMEGWMQRTKKLTQRTHDGMRAVVDQAKTANLLEREHTRAEQDMAKYADEARQYRKFAVEPAAEKLATARNEVAEEMSAAESSAKQNEEQLRGLEENLRLDLEHHGTEVQSSVVSSQAYVKDSLRTALSAVKQQAFTAGQRIASGENLMQQTRSKEVSSALQQARATESRAKAAIMRLSNEGDAAVKAVATQEELLRAKAEEELRRAQQAGHGAVAGLDRDRELAQEEARKLNQGEAQALTAVSGLGGAQAAERTALQHLRGEDAHEWQSDVAAAQLAVNDEVQAAERLAARERGLEAADQLGGQQAAKGLQAEQAKERSRFEEALDAANEHHRVLTPLLNKEWKLGRDAVDKEQKAFGSRLNGRLPTFQKPMEEMQALRDQVSNETEHSAALEQQRKEVLTAFKSEVTNDQAEQTDEVAADAREFDWQMRDFDTWLSKFQTNDRTFNTKVWSKLQELGVDAEQDAATLHRAGLDEAADLEQRQARQHWDVQHGLDGAKRNEQHALASLEIANEHLYAKLASAEGLNELEKQQLMHQIRQSSQTITQGIMSQQAHLQDQNHRIAMHLSKFNEAIATAEKLLPKTGGSTGVDALARTIQRKVSQLGDLPLFGAPAPAPDALPPGVAPGSLAQVGAGEALRLASLRAEDAELARANAALERELDAAGGF